MTDTPTKQENQSKTENAPSSNANEQRRGNRNNDRKRNRRGDSKNERDSEWQERVVQIRRVSKTVKGGKKMSFRAIVVVGNEKGQVGVGVGKAGDVIGAVRKGFSDCKKHLFRVPLTPNNSPTLDEELQLDESLSESSLSSLSIVDAEQIVCCASSSITWAYI